MSLPFLLLLPVVLATAGAAVAAFRPPSAGTRSAVQHFAAGVVFSVVAVELLPDVVRVHDPWEIGWTFAAGVAMMLVIERLSRRFDSDEDASPSPATRGPSIGGLVAIGVDVLLDGLLLGIAFAAGQKEGVLLTVALSLELLSLGLATAVSLTRRGASRVRAVIVPMAISALLVPGALVGLLVLRNASTHTMAGVLSFGSAALLYLVTEELLVEAHEAPDTTVGTAMFFAGFLLFLLLGMVG